MIGTAFFFPSITFSFRERSARINAGLLLPNATNRDKVQALQLFCARDVCCPLLSVVAVKRTLFIYWRFCDVSGSILCRLDICDVRAFNERKKKVVPVVVVSIVCLRTGCRCCGTC